MDACVQFRVRRCAVFASASIRSTPAAAATRNMVQHDMITCAQKHTEPHTHKHRALYFLSGARGQRGGGGGGCQSAVDRPEFGECVCVNTYVCFQQNYVVRVFILYVCV